MARRLSAVLTVVLLGLSSSVVHADSFGVTLRYWNAEESAPGSTTITPILSVTTEDTRSDVPGLTLRWSPDFWENHDFLFSYYEKDRDRVIRASRNPLDGSPSEVGTDFRGSERSDFELLVRTRANENVFYYYGLRYRNLSLYLDNELSLISSGADVGITFNF